MFQFRFWEYVLGLGRQIYFVAMLMLSYHHFTFVTHYGTYISMDREYSNFEVS